MKKIDFTRIPPCTEGNGETNPWLKDIIAQAKKCLERIVTESKKTEKCNCWRANKDCGVPEKGLRWCDRKVCNNIIAFTGDRGAGKTTAMLEFLSKMTEDETVAYDELPLIDPSRMSDGESLLGFVLANIYDKIKETVGTHSSFKKSDDIESYRNIAGDCMKILQNVRLKTLSAKESMDKLADKRDYMEDSSSSVKLRYSIFRLIKDFLKVRKTEYLVITIDDLDTNIRNGFNIAQEIHSFLSFPNVVILMSVKIEQLADIIEQRYVFDYKDIMGHFSQISTQPAEMAVKYLQKLLPSSHRIQTNQLYLHTLKNIEVKHIGEKATTIPTECKKQCKKEPQKMCSRADECYKLLVDYFLELVYDKTGIILVKDENDAHPLIPLNLRALHHALDLLSGLDDVVEKDDKKIKTVFENAVEGSERLLLNNLNNVGQWLVDSISSNAVPRELAAVFRQAVAHPPEGFCAFLVSQLKHYSQQLTREGRLGLFGKTYSGSSVSASSRVWLETGTINGTTSHEKVTDEIVENILNADSPNKTICLGDILLLLDKIMELDSNEGYGHFAAAIKMLFSLRVTEYLYAGEKPDKKSVSLLLGNMIVHPKVPLTHTGREWNPRAIAV
jgi:hypothetical protein